MQKMKKLLGIVVLGLLLSGCATTESIVSSGKIKKNMKIKLMSNNSEYVIEKVGVFTPKPKDIQELNSGEIGFIITGIKNLSETKYG